MKPPPLLIAGSLLANAGLFGVLAWQPALSPPAFRDFFRRNFHAADEPATAAPSARETPREKTKLWTALGTDDLTTLVARLRAAGFPPDVIRLIVQSEVNARYAERLRALRDPDPNTPFWKLPSTSRLVGSTDKRWEEISRLQLERSKVIREVLSDDFFATNDTTIEQRRKFGDLPRNKIDAVQRIEDDYTDMNSSLRAAMKGIMLPEDREKIALLNREKHADLAALLTPEELADYEVRSSPITDMLRYQIKDFDPTEAEFRAIYQQQQVINEKFPSTGMMGGADYEQRQAAAEQLGVQLKASLGDARYADYVRETSYDYQQLKRLAERDHVPVESTIRAFGVRDTVAESSNRILDDAALSADQKRAALQTLAQETRAQVLATLGATTGEAYLKVINQQWLNAVEKGSAVKFTGLSGSMNNGSATIMLGGGASFRTLPPPPRS